MHPTPLTWILTLDGKTGGHVNKIWKYGNQFMSNKALYKEDVKSRDVVRTQTSNLFKQTELSAACFTWGADLL